MRLWFKAFHVAAMQKVDHRTLPRPGIPYKHEEVLALRLLGAGGTDGDASRETLDLLIHAESEVRVLQLAMSSYIRR
jgi:hypothetical protein